MFSSARMSLWLLMRGLLAPADLVATARQRRQGASQPLMHDLLLAGGGCAGLASARPLSASLSSSRGPLVGS